LGIWKRLAIAVTESTGIWAARRFLRFVLSPDRFGRAFELRPVASVYRFQRRFLDDADRIFRRYRPRWSLLGCRGHALGSWGLFVVWVVPPLVLMLSAARGANRRSQDRHVPEYRQVKE